LNDFTYSPEFFKKVIEETNDAVIIIDNDGKVFFWNNSAEKLYDCKRDDVIGEMIQIFLDEDMMATLKNRISTGEELAGIETKLRTGSGQLVDVDLTMDLIHDSKGSQIGLTIISRDITARKRAERRKNLTIQLLERLNEGTSGPDVIKDLLELVKNYTGFEAVGIRLKEETDYPYFITRGFPGHFVEAEKYLCSYGSDGKLQLDDNNMPILECMCGRVIRGNTDPSMRFFTSNGSFWTNDTDELLDVMTEDELGGPTRNRCNSEGYRSVALIPLRVNDEIVGLMQLNDRKTKRFSPDMINFFEDIGASIGIAFNRMKLEEGLTR
jgi:PAS domain S-box-containing protein